jgi:hypothetical protein
MSTKALIGLELGMNFDEMLLLSIIFSSNPCTVKVKPFSIKSVSLNLKIPQDTTINQIVFLILLVGQ